MKPTSPSNNKETLGQILLMQILNVSKEKDIPPEVVRDFLLDSIKKAFIKSTDADNLEILFDLETGELTCNKLYPVIDEPEELDQYINIMNDDVRVIKLGLQVGDIYKEPFDIQREFRQQQVQQILQSFKQKIIEISNQRIYKSWTPMIGQIILAEIEKEDKKGNFFTIDLENQFDVENKPLEKTLGFLGKKEQNPLEQLDVGKKYHFVVSDVKEQSKYCPVILSRASEKLVEYYMKLEIPEIDDGSIVIEKVARAPGIKTKVLVSSKTLPVEPAAVCVGPKGARIKAISKLLNNEKIDVYNYSEDPIVLIIEALDHIKIVGIKLEEKDNGFKQATIIVSEDLLPQIIGRKGSNVKLISMITEWSINVITEEEADRLNLEYLAANSKEFSDHFKKHKRPSVLRTDLEPDQLDILALNDSEIDDLVNNMSIEDFNNVNFGEVKDEESSNNEVNEEDLLYEDLSNSEPDEEITEYDNNEELNDLNTAFADELEKALK